MILYRCCRGWCILLGLVVSAAPATAQEPTGKKKLNVLFIIADDLNCHLGCYGDRIVKTPNIDRLATRGVQFDRAYCNFPVCNPSRTSFLSGRYPEATKIFQNTVEPRTHLGKDFQFLPEQFKAAGYFIAAHGKIAHFPGAVRWDVFTDPAHEAKDKKEKKGKAKLEGGKNAQGQPFPWQATSNKDEDEPDGQIARRVVKLLEQNKDRPFFIAAGFHRPHTPHVAPKKYFDLYKPADMPLVKEPAGHTKDIPKIAHGQKHTDLTDLQKREIISHYFAVTSFMDAQVGVLLEAMDRLNLWDSTIVIFVSDHGWHLGEHGGFWSKFSLMEESARVPLIVVAPGKSARAHSPRVVELVDLYPTLTNLCGLKTPTGLQGKSFVPLLDSPSQPWKSAAYTVANRQSTLGRSLRTEQYTLIEWPDGSLQLYDFARDPHEYVNLARDPAHAGTIRDLRALMPRSANAPKDSAPSK